MGCFCGAKVSGEKMESNVLANLGEAVPSMHIWGGEDLALALWGGILC